MNLLRRLLTLSIVASLVCIGVAHADDSSSKAPKWTQKFRIHGNADVSYVYGEKNSEFDEGRFAVDNFRLFFDVDVADDTELAGHPLFRSASFYFEWDLVREASLKNKAGSLYLQLDELGGAKSINMRFGRMPIPFGEEYQRFHERRPENPLISYSGPAPYNWDEGVGFFGSFCEEKFRYVFAVMDGDDSFNANTNADPQVALKLIYEPTNWFYASLSGLRTGKLGNADSSAESAIEWGGTHAERLGDGEIDVFRNGDAVARDPSMKLDDVVAWEADVILRREGLGELWMAAGQVFINADSASRHDRDLTYWIVEAVLELGAFSDVLDRFYAASRYSVIGTLDSDEGYMISAMQGGSDFGFNTKRADVISSGIGIRLRKNLIFKTEYTWVDFDLVRGVPSSMKRAAKNRDNYGLGFALSF